jgi:hypothetical protein
MHRLVALTLALSFGGTALAADVDDARLKSADADRGNWLSYGRDYGNQRFSPLTQISKANVKRLVPRWIYQSGVNGTFQATPIVADGVMYVSLPFDHVVAIDAKSGRELWRYQHRRRTEKMCCGPANRGVALAYGKVFIGTVDARLVALDAKSGKIVWDAPLVDDPFGGTTERADQLAADDPLRKQKVSGSTGVGANMAPIVYDGKVVIGITGVGYGLHLDSDRPDAPLGAVVGIAGQSQRAGFYAAFDAATGKRVWQFDSTSPTGWEGQFRTHTPDGEPLQRDIAREKATFAQHADAWKRGGGVRVDDTRGRCGTRPDLPRHRQSVAADGRRHAARRQPVHRVARRTRRGDRQAALVLPAGAARHVGLRRREPARAVRHGHRRRARARHRTGRQDRLVLRARPPRRQAALQVGSLRAAVEHVPASDARRHRDLARRGWWCQLVAGVVRCAVRAGVRRRAAHAHALPRERDRRDGRQAGGALHGPTCADCSPPSFQRKLESSPAVAGAMSAAGPQRSLG